MPRADANIADDMANDFVSHAVDLMRFTGTMRKEALGVLTDLQDELEASINAADILGVTRTAYQQARLDNLLTEVRATIRSGYRGLNATVNSTLAELASVMQLRTINLVNEVFGAEIMSTAMTAQDLKVLLSDSFILGHPNKDWWGKQADDLYHRFAGQIRMGYLQGETNDQLVSRVIGEPTGRAITVTDTEGVDVTVDEYAGGILDISRNAATAQVRTAVMALNNKVQDATFSENSDILDGKQLLVTLDTRTSETCMALSGGAWDFEGNPLPNSPVQIPYPGDPPYHFNCRTIWIPVVKTWEELTGVRGIEEVPLATQASMDGQVAGDLTYEAWLQNQSKDRQLEVLGPGKYKLWNDGKLGLTDMIDQNANPLTLAELRAKAGVMTEGAVE